jgi:general secretion pathway protein K
VTGRREQQGFVLVAAIWFVALLALLGVVIAGWMARSSARTAALGDRFALRLAADDAINRVAYQMSSNFFTQRGLEDLQGADWTLAATAGMMLVKPGTATPFVALDNRPYRLGRVIVRLQDLLGLFDLNMAQPDAIEEMLRVYSVPYTDQGTLVNRLLGYMARWDASAIAGAGPEDYLQAGRPPPRGAPLLTPWEAARVLGWDAYPQLWHGALPLPDIATVGGSLAVNINTAPAAVLESLPGFDPQAVANLLSFRSQYLLSGSIDVEQASGIDMPYDLFRYAFFPNGNVRLTITAPDAPLYETVEIRRTPVAAPAPYRIDYVIDRPEGGRDPAAAGFTGLADFPIDPASQ